MSFRQLVARWLLKDLDRAGVRRGCWVAELGVGEREGAVAVEVDVAPRERDRTASVVIVGMRFSGTFDAAAMNSELTLDRDQRTAPRRRPARGARPERSADAMVRATRTRGASSGPHPGRNQPQRPPVIA